MQLYSSLLITEYTVSVYWTVASDLDSWSLFFYLTMFYFCLWTSFNTQKWQWAALMFRILHVDTNKCHQEMSLRHCGHVNLSCITIQVAVITDAFQHDCWRISTFWLNCNLTLLFTHFHSLWVISTACLNGKCRFYCPFTDRLKN